MAIPFLSFEHTNSQIKKEILRDFEAFLDESNYIMGPSLESFEQNYASFSNSKFCLGVGNGLDALHIGLRSLRIGHGDEVIIPANTFIASALAISYCGAKPVLVDPLIDTYNIDPVNIREKITSRTKAIMPVHLYGQACNMSEILAIARDYNLKIVEDNAQGHGATWNSQITGSFGHINATSFYPGKNLGAYGDGGALTTNSSDIYHVAAELRNYGSSKKYVHERLGFNSRLDECQSRFLSIKLKYIKEWNLERKKIADFYEEKLSNIGDLIIPTIDDRATSSYHQYVIRTRERDALQQHLKSKGVQTLIHYPIPIYNQRCYSDLNFNPSDYPITQELSKTILSLPIYPGLKHHQLSIITQNIIDFFSDER